MIGKTLLYIGVGALIVLLLTLLIIRFMVGSIFSFLSQSNDDPSLGHVAKVTKVTTTPPPDLAAMEVTTTQPPDLTAMKATTTPTDRAVTNMHYNRVLTSVGPTAIAFQPPTDSVSQTQLWQLDPTTELLKSTGATNKCLVAPDAKTADL